MKKIFAVVFTLMLLAGPAFAADEDWNSNEENATTPAADAPKAGIAALAQNPAALRAMINIAKARAKQNETQVETEKTYE